MPVSKDSTQRRLPTEKSRTRKTHLENYLAAKASAKEYDRDFDTREWWEEFKLPKKTAMKRTLQIDEFWETLQRSGTHTVALDVGIQLTLDVTHINSKVMISDAEDQDCFELSVFPESNSILHSLALGKTCRHREIKGFGTRLLQLADRINKCFDVAYMELSNQAEFNNVNADCLYSKLHHGMGWYISRGFLVSAGGYPADEDNWEQYIHATNLEIQEWNDYWNTVVSDNGQMRRDQKDDDCENWEEERPLPSSNTMVKLYITKVNQYTPQNPLAPALVYIGKLDKTKIQKVENFNYSTSQKLLRQYKQEIAQKNSDVDYLTSLLRQVYPSPPDSVIKQQVEKDMRL